MGDMLREGSDWLTAQRTAHMSFVVTYRHDEQDVSVSATIGRTTFDHVDESGFIQRVESRDYLIAAETLTFPSGTILPEAGDQIIEFVAELPPRGQRFVYEVVALGGEPPWRYSDLYRKTLRIHTTLLRVEVM